MDLQVERFCIISRYVCT